MDLRLDRDFTAKYAPMSNNNISRIQILIGLVVMISACHASASPARGRPGFDSQMGS
ncbi:hypothetical protein AC578_326 [Pseudocercospora eumusae]|uniref:Uncharacterized protein n=1 Tax=Pseudocercospora eumusae TaxID=321146 RepID=A0A139HU53_9PEZI|nr:hypothetical protein AC578_326 [Pseudocercospora eumusae]